MYKLQTYSINNSICYAHLHIISSYYNLEVHICQLELVYV